MKILHWIMKKRRRNVVFAVSVFTLVLSTALINWHNEIFPDLISGGEFAGSERKLYIDEPAIPGNHNDAPSTLKESKNLLTIIKEQDSPAISDDDNTSAMSEEYYDTSVASEKSDSAPATLRGYNAPAGVEESKDVTSALEKNTFFASRGSNSRTATNLEKPEIIQSKESESLQSHESEKLQSKESEDQKPKESEKLQSKELAKIESGKAELSKDYGTVPQRESAREDAAADKKRTESGSSVAEQELDLLARLITAEAQGEPYQAQVAVGAVVMNRVKSNEWPNSIQDVIYHKIGGYDQFAPVVNGWINKAAKEECIKAAKAAMNGADPTNGALFYYDDSTTNEWMLSKKISIKIGRMVFAF